MVIDDLKTNSDPFYSKDNIVELERRVNDLKTGKSKLSEHELIEESKIDHYSLHFRAYIAHTNI